jgi:hypothetical protein
MIFAPRCLVSKSTRSLLASLALVAGLGCGSSSNDDDANGSPPSNSNSPPSPPTPAAPSGPQGAPAGIPPEAVAAVTEAFGMAADQIEAACGASFDACEATPGCNEILACAAGSGCSGASCYCADASCDSPGPCRATIDGAPGARVPDAEDPSLGPAPAAATAVGACLQGLTGGANVPNVPTPAPASDPVDAGASDPVDGG